MYSGVEIKKELSEKYKNNEANLKKKYMDRIVQQLDEQRTLQSNSLTYSYYYEKLYTNIGINQHGSCAYVALCMSISYYDSILDDNIIDEIYDVSSYDYFNSYSSISTSSYNNSPGTTDYFHTDMILAGRLAGYTESNKYTIDISDYDNLIEDYFEDKGYDITTHTTGWFTNRLSFCKDAIDSDNPVVINISGNDGTIDLGTDAHAIVGYEYDSSGIYTHFGWGPATTHYNINGFTIDDAFYYEIDANHSCSNNYTWMDSNYCTGTVCICGIRHCNHESKHHHGSNSTTHTYVCNSCGTSFVNAHNFYISGSNKICSICGYTIDIHHSHSYSYTPLNSHMHTGTCSCGNTIQESCVGIVMLDGHSYCLKCGQMIS